MEMLKDYLPESTLIAARVLKDRAKLDLINNTPIKDEDTQALAKKITNLVLSFRIPMVFKDTVRKRLWDEIRSDSVMTELFLEMSADYIRRCRANNVELDETIEAVAEAYGYKTNDYSVNDEELDKVLSTPPSIVATLAANSWLLLIIELETLMVRSS